jgi:hypothetical protein
MLAQFTPCQWQFYSVGKHLDEIAEGNHGYTGSGLFASFRPLRLCGGGLGVRCDHRHLRERRGRLVRINADRTTVVDLPAFGATGPYLKISGTFDGELDPYDLHNAPIADIEFALRSNGKVRHTSTFYVLGPLDLAKGNRRLFYEFGNRGNKRILEWFNDSKGI